MSSYIFWYKLGEHFPPKSQKNMDNSIFKALNFDMEGIEATLISYDIMCQWSVHMMERVNASSYLKLPNNLELRLAISLFIFMGIKIPA